MRALITGITGQDGSYLAEYLHGLGYEVHGFTRRVAAEDQALRFSRLRDVKRYVMHLGSVENLSSILTCLTRVRFDEVYHLAAQSDVRASFADPHTTIEINVCGTLNMLDAVRHAQPEARFYFAASSEMFGDATPPQNERTPFCPRSTYGVSKVAGFHLTRHYREAYGMKACSGILFNHESPRRGHEFVTRKVTSFVARTVHTRSIDHPNWEEARLPMGDLSTARDWGHAQDYVRAMHLIVNAQRGDFVIATGKIHTIEEMLEVAFSKYDLDWRQFVVLDQHFIRPLDIKALCGDASMAREVLSWEPEIDFPAMIENMVETELKTFSPTPRR